MANWQTEQEEKEAPGKFLDRLREALRRFTEIDLESEVTQSFKLWQIGRHRTGEGSSW